MVSFGVLKKSTPTGKDKKVLSRKKTTLIPLSQLSHADHLPEYIEAEDGIQRRNEISVQTMKCWRPGPLIDNQPYD